MAKYRKKPVVIEAFKFSEPIKAHEFPQWFWDAIESADVEVFSDHCMIETLEGTHKANMGDWIIKGVNGEIYPCKPGIFEKTYEEVLAQESGSGDY